MTDPAESLPWLAPDAASLVAMTTGGSTLWPAVRRDPAAVLLLLRVARQSTSADLASARIASLHFARRRLNLPPVGVLNSDKPAVAALLRWTVSLAETCERLAVATHYPYLQRAWCAGLLAPLGRLATAAAPSRLAAVAVARRLALAWNLPPWLAAVVGQLDLPSSAGLAPDRRLFALVRLAIAVVSRSSADLAKLPGLTSDEETAGLRLADCPAPLPPVSLPARGDPFAQPLLRRLIDATLEAERLREEAIDPERLHRDIDALHAALGSAATPRPKNREMPKSLRWPSLPPAPATRSITRSRLLAGKRNTFLPTARSGLPPTKMVLYAPR